VALANPANYPMTDTSRNALYGLAFHSHTLGTTTALLPSHEPVEPETDFTSSPHRSSLSAVPYKRSLLCPRGQRRRGTSPVWMFRHYLQVTARITRIVREDNRIQTPRESQPKPRSLLRRQGGSSQESFRPKRSPSEQRWPASSRRSIAGTPWLRSPGAELHPEFCQRFLHKYGLAQVGLSLCYSHRPHRLCYD
jgi:hypothetical protein